MIRQMIAMTISIASLSITLPSFAATFDPEPTKPPTSTGSSDTRRIASVEPAQGCKWVGKVIICPDSVAATIEPPTGNPTPSRTADGGGKA